MLFLCRSEIVFWKLTQQWDVNVVSTCFRHWNKVISIRKPHCFGDGILISIRHNFTSHFKSESNVVLWLKSWCSFSILSMYKQCYINLQPTLYWGSNPNMFSMLKTSLCFNVEILMLLKLHFDIVSPLIQQRFSNWLMVLKNSSQLSEGYTCHSDLVTYLFFVDVSLKASFCLFEYSHLWKNHEFERKVSKDTIAECIDDVLFHDMFYVRYYVFT